MESEAIPLSNWLKDNLIAPEMSKFTEAAIPAMSTTDDQQEHWLANCVLNNLFGPRRFVTPLRQQAYHFLRRSHAAFTEYALAREATLDYLADTERGPRYIDAINHWEAFMAYSWQAYRFLGRGRAQWFEKNDGSVLQRLNVLYNRSKYADEAIERGDFVEESPLCVWLTNNALSNTEATPTFDEIAEILTYLAGLASAVQDPANAESKIKAQLAGTIG
jgi:hypothetical protein